MATTDPRDGRQMFGTGDLALFLGGGEDSFTGLLLVLIGKARATPGDYSRLKFAFPREVRAWETWMAMSPAPTFAQCGRRCRSMTPRPRLRASGIWAGMTRIKVWRKPRRSGRG